MAIIKLTEQVYKTIDPTKTGWGNMQKISEKIILFNTSEMIICDTEDNGCTRVTYKRAMVDSFFCKETIDQIYKLIQKEN